MRSKQWLILTGILAGILGTPSLFADIKIVESPFRNKSAASAALAQEAPQSQSATEQVSAKKNFLWQATKDETIIYLLGSIHVFRRDLYPLDPAIEKAYMVSKSVAVEVNLNRLGSESQAALQKLAMYEDGSTLRDHLSAGAYDQAATFLKKMGLPIQAFDRFKPWYLSMQLTQMMMAKLGYETSMGIDRYFLSQAQGAKRIDELEGFERQLRFFEGLNERQQEKFLLYTIRDFDQIGSLMDKMIQAWQVGDHKAMEQEFVLRAMSDLDMAPIMEELLFKRNHEMVEKIDQYAKPNSPYFVIVGAAHMVGERGMVRLFESKGYALKQL